MRRSIAGFLALVASGDHDKLLRELTIEKMEPPAPAGTAELLAGWSCSRDRARPGKSFGYTVHQGIQVPASAPVCGRRRQTCRSGAPWRERDRWTGKISIRRWRRMT